MTTISTPNLVTYESGPCSPSVSPAGCGGKIWACPALDILPSIDFFSSCCFCCCYYYFCCDSIEKRPSSKNRESVGAKDARLKWTQRDERDRANVIRTLNVFAMTSARIESMKAAPSGLRGGRFASTSINNEQRWRLPHKRIKKRLFLRMESNPVQRQVTGVLLYTDDVSLFFPGRME